MSGERCSIWDDPNVQMALRDGRTPDDIAILNCAACGTLSYYNQGSGFSCRECGASFTVCTENEDPPEVGAYIRLDYVMTLQDAADAECEDY